MSFGTSPSDVDTVVAFCKALYRKCRDAGGEYDEISQEVRGLHTVLKHLKYELEAPDSPVNKERSAWSRQLSPLVGDCDYTLRELDDLLRKDNRFSSSPKSARGDIERRGSNLDTLALIRVKLLNHKSKLTKFMDNVQLDQCQGKPEELYNSDGHLDDILDKVDIIAARIQSRNERSSTKRDDDDKEVWKQFRKELIAEGFSSEVLEHHRDVLRAYIREIDQKGLLDETPSRSGPATTGAKGAERWLESVKVPRPHDNPPTFSSLDLPTEDASAKAVPAREENMKFPQSMKLDLRQPPPEVRGDGEYPLTKTISSSSRQRRTSGNSHRLPPQVPRLITSNENDEKAVQYFNTDSSSNEDSDHEHRRRSKKPQIGEVIKTTELVAYSQALQLHPHSPSSFRSTQDYFGEDASPRALSYQPKKQIEYGTSPIQAGAIPIPQPNPRSSNSSFSAPSRSATFRLAPDENGKEIPHDAKWTKINRRLVSPEVLDQDHLRYEARPEFVAVLGVLSRAEIESLAERSRILRDARHRRSLPTQAPSPAQPPRPIPIPAPSNHRHRSGRDTPSSSESDSDSSGSDDRRRRKSKGRKGYAGSNVGAPVSGYPNPFGQPLPSPVRSPGNREFKDRRERDHDRERDQERDRDREWKSKDKDYDRDHDRDRDRDRDRDGSRHRRRKSRSRDHRDSHRDRDRDGDRGGGRGGGSYSKSSRWKETLTAAGIGGAAVSLLNVLSEAAEGL